MVWFTYIFTIKSRPNVGRYTIHGYHGLGQKSKFTLNYCFISFCQSEWDKGRSHSTWQEGGPFHVAAPRITYTSWGVLPSTVIVITKMLWFWLRISINIHLPLTSLEREHLKLSIVPYAWRQLFNSPGKSWKSTKISSTRRRYDLSLIEQAKLRYSRYVSLTKKQNLDSIKSDHVIVRMSAAPAKGT